MASQNHIQARPLMHYYSGVTRECILVYGASISFLHRHQLSVLRVRSELCQSICDIFEQFAFVNRLSHPVVYWTRRYVACSLFGNDIILTCPIRGQKSHAVAVGPCPVKRDVKISRDTSATPLSSSFGVFTGRFVLTRGEALIIKRTLSHGGRKNK
ncbi:hypothetical protein BDY19DRAFT_180435 [Irpex rosettiformis]|uniref:Uncharacterized protein n=1 Tax=Irpex rosettiformis TaxID=378272 RepID=A0ACB8U2V3_9APHY|nr:hypothetical protein BDY19DRAFT_180435 [Irpex rosettiformis]